MDKPVDEPVIYAPATLSRRFWAFVLDTIILGIAGNLAALSMSSVLYEIGPYGRLGGEFVALLYFGLMNSWIGGGQTLGKRITGIAVRDSEGQSIGIGRSFLRTSIWLVPWTLNGWSSPIMRHPIAGPILLIIGSGLGPVVVLAMLFNRQSRQGLHDMLTRTYVLYLRGTAVEALPPSARRQWILSAVTAFLAVAATVAVIIMSQPKTQLQHVLERDPHFFSVDVSSLTDYQKGTRTRSLRIEGWHMGELTDDEQTAVINGIARQALTIGDLAGYDRISIDLDSAYDFGIASGHRHHLDTETIVEWRNRVGRSR